MSDLLFSKVIPGGNATILLHEPALDDSALADASGRIMQPMHLQAEQVGALFVSGRKLPYLRMMGGEFCVNATRAAAFLLAGMGLLERFPDPVSNCKTDGSTKESHGSDLARGAVWKGRIEVSGMPDPLDVLVASDEDCLQRAAASSHYRSCHGHDSGTDNKKNASAPGSQHAHEQGGMPSWPECMPSSLFSAARVRCARPATVCEAIAPGICLVTMPGMMHLLVDAQIHAMPSMLEPLWKEAAGALRRQYGIANAPASGVIWHTHTQGHSHIWPAVEVKASASEHLETACGSASLALALWELAKTGERVERPIKIVQPSGLHLSVFPEYDEEQDSAVPGAAWIAGPVYLAAQGRAFL